MIPHPEEAPQPRPGLTLLFGRLLLSHRRAFLICLALFTLAAIGGLTRLRFESEPRTIFERDDADFAQLEEYFEQFGADDNDILVVLHGEGLFTAEFSRTLEAFTREAAAVDGVRSVMSIRDVRGAGGTALFPSTDRPPTEFEVARKLATTVPLLAGQLVSKDGRTMLVTLTLREQDAQTISSAEPVFRRLKELATSSFAPLSIEANLAGSVVVRVETLAGVRNEFFQIMAIGGLVASLIAFAIFRRFTTTLMVSSGPILATTWTLGLMGWLGLDVDGISTPLPAIVLVVAFANAVHLMLDIIRSRQAGHSHEEAARDVVRHLGLACFLTSLTTAIGFASLMLAETGSVQRFGFASAMGSLLGFCANLTIIPLLASITHRGAIRNSRAESAEHAAASLLARTGAHLLKFAGPITALAVLATILLAWSATNLKSDIVWTETLPTDSEVTRAMTRCDQAFGGTEGAFIIAGWEAPLDYDNPEVLAVLHSIEDLVVREPLFAGPLSLLNFLPPSDDPASAAQALRPALDQVPASLRDRMLRADLRRTVLSFHLPNRGAAVIRPAVQRLREDLRTLTAAHPGFTIHLTGSAVVAADNMTAVIGDLVRSLSFASITVFLVLTIALRSLTLGLLSIIPNAFPLLLNAGFLALLDKPLQITSVLTFSICLGIAVDDTIHFLMRFLRERQAGRSVRDAIVHSFERVGTALLITTAIIAGGFAGAMTSDMPGLVLFGTLASSALVAALVGDLVILPAMLAVVLGRKEKKVSSVQ